MADIRLFKNRFLTITQPPIIRFQRKFARETRVAWR